jgi:tetratricopeptide (TPR) repeat protein
MGLKCFLRSFIVLALCSACASGPAPERSPRPIRQSLRYLNKGTALYTRGCFPEALARFSEAHERYTAADHLEGVAASLNNIANVYFQLNDLGSALLVFDDAIAVFETLDDRRGLIRAMTNKGAALIAADRPEEGEAFLDKADALAAGTDLLSALRLKNRAILQMDRQDFTGAKQTLEQAIGRSGENAPEEAASVHYTMGRILSAEQNPAGAITHFNTALDIDRSRGAYMGIAQDLAALGSSYAAMGQYDQAVFHYRRSLKVFALLGNTPAVRDIRRSLEDAAAQTGADIRSTIHWVEQWRKGNKQANLCR